MHLGLARTALLGWLRARSSQGAFVLRIEDLDTQRVVKGAAQAILEDLTFLGLDWDEGPDVGGPHGPYVQSARLARYDAALSALEREGHVYPCSCSRKEIALASAPHGLPELGPVYPGTCRSGPTRPELPTSLRFRLPDAELAFDDGLHGRVSVPREVLSDFVLRRADGLHSYQLAVVVDDIAMGITEVLRGDDLLSCTPYQLALYDALSAPRPKFVHVPLMLGPDAKRLAKRHGAQSIASYRAQGKRPEQIVGFLAWSLGLVKEPREHSARDLIERFELCRLARTPSVVDADALG